MWVGIFIIRQVQIAADNLYLPPKSKPTLWTTISFNQGCVGKGPRWEAFRVVIYYSWDSCTDTKINKHPFNMEFSKIVAAAGLTMR